MDSQQIEQLHQQASELYLAGDFDKALASWEQLLTLNPSDERAQEGVRLCRLMTAAGSVPASDDPQAQTIALDGLGRDLDDVSGQSPAAPPAQPVAPQPVQAQPVAPQPVTPQPVQAQPQPATPQPQSATPQPQPATPQPGPVQPQPPTHPQSTPVAAPPSDPPLELDLDLDLSAIEPVVAPAPVPTPVEPAAVTPRAVAPTEVPAASIEDMLAIARSHLAAGSPDLAVEACRKILATEPFNQAAVGLLAQCEQAKAAPAAQPGAGLEDAARQDEGIDFGVEEMPAGLPLAAEPDANEPKHGIEGLVTAPADSAATAASGTAAGELARRLQELYDEARAAAAEGRRDDALGVLARVLILDETHQPSQDLQQELLSESEQIERRIEHLIGEGVQLQQIGEHAKAAKCFRQVLALSPAHGEARYLLDQIESQYGVGLGEDGPAEAPASSEPEPTLAHVPQEAEEGTEALPLATQEPSLRMQAVPIAGAPARRPAPLEEEPAEEPDPASATRVRAASGGSAAPAAAPVSKTRLLVTTLILIGLASGGVWYGMQWWNARHGTDPAAPTTTTSTNPTGNPTDPGPTPSAGGTDGGPGPATPRPNDAQRAREALARAREAFRRGDYQAAVLGYNEVLAIEPQHTEALDGLREAGAKFRVAQEERQQLERARGAFEDQSWGSALRLLYRLPESMDRKLVEGYIVNGWYNMGVQRLQGGAIREAIESFDEALAIDATDRGVRAARALAEKFREAPRDAEYYRTVEALAYRAMDD